MSGEMADPEVSACVICDDIRLEASGKHILIGVYPHNLILPRAPFEIRLFFWLQFHAVETGALELNGELSASDGDRLEFEFGLDVHAAGPVAFPSPAIRLNINGPGELTLRLRFGTADWKTVKSLPIVIAAPAEPIETAPERPAAPAPPGARRPRRRPKP